MADETVEQLWREMYGDTGTLVDERYPECAPLRRRPVVRDEVEVRQEALLNALRKQRTGP